MLVLKIPARWRGVSGLVAALILSAGAQASLASASKPDACALIDPAAAAKLLGTSVTPKPVDTKAAGPEAASLCSYQTAKVGGGFLLAAASFETKDLTADLADLEKAAATRTAPASLNLPKPKVTDITGLGDGAFLVDGGMFFELHVFAYGDKIMLSRNVQPTRGAVDQAEALARLAISGLR